VFDNMLRATGSTAVSPALGSRRPHILLRSWAQPALGYREVPQLENRRDPLIYIGHVSCCALSDACPGPDPLFEPHGLKPIDLRTR
jgi:hypothetical protein